MSAAREAILRYFDDPPRQTPEDLGVVFTSGGVACFACAAGVVEITPSLPVSMLPGSSRGVAFWRGRAIEVRGRTGDAKNFVLIRDASGVHFVVSETLPRAVSRADAEDVPLYRGSDGE